MPEDGTIELVVSDNCSTDGTKEVLERASAKTPYLRWSTNPTNVGFAMNVVNATKLASGAYCLWVGDDDVFIDGALKYYLEKITAHQNCDWFAINFYEVLQADLDNGNVLEPDFCRQKLWKLRLPDVCERNFETWEKAIEVPGGVDLEFYFAIFACIFRRTAVTEVLSKVDPRRCQYNPLEGWLYTEEAYYIHTFLLIEALPERPGMILPEPFYVQGIGTTRGDDSGKVSFPYTVMPNLWIWVYPQVWSHISSRCVFEHAQLERLSHRMFYPCLKQLQDRAFKKKSIFASRMQGVSYLWSIRYMLVKYPLETIKFSKNLLPTSYIDTVSALKRSVRRLIK